MDLSYTLRNRHLSQQNIPPLENMDRLIPPKIVYKSDGNICKN